MAQAQDYFTGIFYTDVSVKGKYDQCPKLGNKLTALDSETSLLCKPNIGLADGLQSKLLGKSNFHGNYYC